MIDHRNMIINRIGNNNRKTKKIASNVRNLIKRRV